MAERRKTAPASQSTPNASATKMRTAWVAAKTGNLDALELQELPIVSPKADEITIAVRAIGLNFADVFAVLGLYSATPNPPFVPGLEFAGVVEAVGSNVKHFQLGERVMGVTRFGAYSTHITAPAIYTRPIPKDWSFAEGAAFLCQALTAYYALVDLAHIHAEPLNPNPNAKKRILVHSAAGGVGLLALHLIRAWGLEAIAVVGNENKVDTVVRVGGLSREQVIVRTNAKLFPAQLNSALRFLDTKQQAEGSKFESNDNLPGFDGLDVVLDSIGGDYFLPGLQAMNPGGRLILFGSASLMPQGNLSWYNVRNWLALAIGWLWRPRLDPVNMISENKSVCAFNLIWLTNCVSALTKATNQLLEEWARAKLPPPLVGHTFSFGDMVSALKFFQTGRSVGKVVITVDEQ